MDETFAITGTTKTTQQEETVYNIEKKHREIQILYCQDVANASFRS
jgi:hypothetical protein